MRIQMRRIAVAVTVSAVLPLALTACSDSDSKDKASDTASAGSSKASDPASPSDSMGSMTEPFGPACSSVPKDGAGSFDGMAKDPAPRPPRTIRRCPRW